MEFPETWPMAQSRRLDRACDRFESAFSDGREPAIEDFIEEFDGQEQEVAFRALLEVELEILRRQGTEPAQSAYERRFPRFQSAVEQVFADRPPPPMPESASAARTDSPIDPANPQQTFGTYQIKDLAGRGAFGRVYRAFDPELGRDVAIKIPNDPSTADRERFLSEARAAAVLRHQNICPIHEVAEENGTPYLVLAFIEGETLTQHLKRHELSQREAAWIVHQIAMALAEGKPWHSFQIKESHRILYILAEGGYFSIRERIRMLLGTAINFPEDKLFLWPVRPFNILDSSDFAELSQSIDRYDPDIIFLDPMRKLHTADENDNGAMQAVMSRFRSLITDKGRSLMLSHHTNKGNHSARGASAIIGDCDTVLKLEWNKSDKTIATHSLRAEKVRHGPVPADLALSFDSNTLKFITHNPLGRDRIYTIMRNKGGHIGSRKALVDQLTVMGAMKSSNAYALVNKAIDANIICLEADSSLSLSIPVSSVPQDSNAQTGKK